MKIGLEDVVAAETALSDVDGEAGRLIIRGASLDELVRDCAFEEVLALLLDGLIDGLPQSAQMSAALGAARLEMFGHTAAIDSQLLSLSPIEAMRALAARLADGDDHKTALRLVAAPAVFTTALLRKRRGLTPVAPDPSLAHADDILHMMTGERASADAVAALNAYLVAISDHGLNASTFAARIVASTQAGLTSSVVAAIGALKGPLHGGAPGPVLDMLDGVGGAANADAWLEDALANGKRLMGFGHRIYRVRDPRADALKYALRALQRAGGVKAERLELAEAVERAALAALRRRKPDRPLDTNVEFYTALLLEALGFPRDSFTCVFAIGRVGGWIAHAREQALEGRLLRPLSRYVGPQPKVAA